MAHTPVYELSSGLLCQSSIWRSLLVNKSARFFYEDRLWICDNSCESTDCVVKRLYDHLLLLDIFMCITTNIYICVQFIYYISLTQVKTLVGWSVNLSYISMEKTIFIWVKTCEFSMLYYLSFHYLIHIWFISINVIYHEHYYLEIIYWSDLDLGLIHNILLCVSLI